MHIAALYCLMKVIDFITEKKLQSRVEIASVRQNADPAILSLVFGLPLRKSRAVRRLGSYVARSGVPIEIRLQFSQEEELLIETFLHELAHCLDHLSNQAGQPYRKAHGPGWRNWAVALGIEPSRCGESRVLRDLVESRLKVVAVCIDCGYELRRLRKLPRRRRYIHPQCGGRLKPV